MPARMLVSDFGVSDAVKRLRDRGLKIGSTTGYTRPMLDVLLPHAVAMGYAPDCAHVQTMSAPDVLCLG